MARELGMNPKKLGSIDNHDQEPWQEPLPQFIEHLYQKRFGRERPEIVVPIEQHARQLAQKKAERPQKQRDPPRPTPGKARPDPAHASPRARPPRLRAGTRCDQPRTALAGGLRA
jgi:hypothetical protein